MEKGLVNILTPAYNCSSLITRLLDSVLEQTYPNIEMFVVDDGSTDDTANVVKSYINKFLDRGYKLNYIYQTNQGQSYAINNGLKLLNGEYLLWPDSDDWYKYSFSIEHLVNALNNTDSSIAIARCEYERINEISLKPDYISSYKKKYSIDWLFEDALYNRGNLFWEPGGYIIKLSYLDKYILNREIFVARDTGQNIQILLPYFYYSKCVTLHETLFCYLIRKKSHSKGMYAGFERFETRELCHKSNFLHTFSTLSDINPKKKQVYLNVINGRYYKTLFLYALQNKKYDKALFYKTEMEKNGVKASCLEKMYLRYSDNSFVNYIFNLNNKKINVKKIFAPIFLLLFMFSLIILDQKIPYYSRLYINNTFKGVGPDDGGSFEKLVYNGVVEKMRQEYVSDHCIIYQKSFSKSLFEKKIPVFNFGEYGLLLHYAFLYADNTNDKGLKEIIKHNFDKGFKKVETVICRNDQTTYGNVAIDLYKYTKEKYYLDYANLIFHRLDSLDKKDGILLYGNGATLQHVDGLGITNQFLYYYGKTFENKRAIEIADKMIIDFIKWGVDDVTGMPVQTYDIHSHLKLNRCNWGRGVSWYLLGISELDYNKLSNENTERIEKLISFLLNDKDKLFNQYIGEGKLTDMSATIPVLWFLITKGYLKMSKNDFAKIVSPFFDEKGIMRWCSPTIAMPQEKPNAWQSNMAFQGLTLYLLSQLK